MSVYCVAEGFFQSYDANQLASSHFVPQEVIFG